MQTKESLANKVFGGLIFLVGVPFFVWLVQDWHILAQAPAMLGYLLLVASIWPKLWSAMGDKGQQIAALAIDHWHLTLLLLGGVMLLVTYFFSPQTYQQIAKRSHRVAASFSLYEKFGGDNKLTLQESLAHCSSLGERWQLPTKEAFIDFVQISRGRLIEDKSRLSYWTGSSTDPDQTIVWQAVENQSGAFIWSATHRSSQERHGVLCLRSKAD